MGLRQKEKPLLGEEGIRPALMISSATSAAKFDALSQDAPKPAAYPAIEYAKSPSPMMLEILEPATKRPIQRRNDRFK